MKAINLLFSLAIIMGIAYYFYRKLPKFNEQEKAPDFVSYTPSGDSIRLSDLRGNIVLLDFWGSWCVPCRPVISELIALQDENNGAFEIVSIALEKRKGAGKKAAEILGLNWKYQIEEVSNFVAFNGIARAYGVTDIPATFLINPKGELVGKMHVSDIRRQIGLN